MTQRIINCDLGSQLPKYRQIIESVNQAIEKRLLRMGDRVPSINQVCFENGVCRDTVMLAYNDLKSKGVLASHPGKGYYVARTDIKLDERVFVLFDELNAFKEDLYNSFVAHLNAKTTVEIFFHHFNYQVFKSLVLDSVGKYTSWVIMPATFDNIAHLIQRLPAGRVYILDRLKSELKHYPVVYQDFERDTWDAMMASLPLLRKYRKLIFIHPGGKEPAERVQGFKRFCQHKGFEFSIIKSISEVKPNLYEAYFVPSDRTLVELIKLAKEYKFKLGRNFGVVSFNDTMLKEVVSRGISTISTDFVGMGHRLADMVNNHKNDQVRNPSRFISRKSL